MLDPDPSDIHILDYSMSLTQASNHRTCLKPNILTTGKTYRNTLINALNGFGIFTAFIKFMVIEVKN